MGEILKWRDDRECQCACRYCTPLEDEVFEFYVGELCPTCSRGTLEEDDKFPGWVKCCLCNFWGKGVEEPIDEQSDKSDKTN